MKLSFLVYAIRDSRGNEWGTVAEDQNITVQVYGLYDSKGQPALFEAEAYHLKSFADDNGFDFFVKAREMNIHIPSRSAD